MTDPITGKTNYSVAGLKAASEQFYYDNLHVPVGTLNINNSGIKKPVKPESIQDKLSRLGIGPDKSQKGPVKPRPLPYGAITNDEMETAPASDARFDEFERPIKPPNGGKKRKSKRMKTRYRKKYKGKRSNKTRRYRK